MKGDGESTCFSSVDDTGVPALQQWCHSLTVSSRERSARSFLTNVKAFSNTVASFVADVGDVTVADRELLREKWESVPGQDDPYVDAPYSFNEDVKPKVKNGTAGITFRMVQVRQPFYCLLLVLTISSQEFGAVVENCVEDLQKLFRDGLQDKCRAGATNVRLCNFLKCLQTHRFLDRQAPLQSRLAMSSLKGCTGGHSEFS